MFVKLTNMEKAMAGHQHIMAYYTESPCAANGFKARASRAILHGGMVAQLNTRVAAEVATSWAQFSGNPTPASASTAAKRVVRKHAAVGFDRLRHGTQYPAR